jgi:hypothetical protein
MTAVEELKRQMEAELGAFYSLPIDGFFEVNLQAFLLGWERKFAPFVRIRFSYKITGSHLDILATIPADALPLIASSISGFIIDMRRRPLRP